jgi:hypothetical protein
MGLDPATFSMPTHHSRLLDHVFACLCIFVSVPYDAQQHAKTSTTQDEKKQHFIIKKLNNRKQ